MRRHHRRMKEILGGELAEHDFAPVSSGRPNVRNWKDVTETAITNIKFKEERMGNLLFPVTGTKKTTTTPQCSECKDTGIAYYSGVGDDTCRSCGGSQWQKKKQELEASKPVKTEAVNHPAHYNAGKYEVIDVIEDWDLGFNLGNTIKYIARAEHKGKELEDLEKALWYLKRRIEQVKVEQ